MTATQAEETVRAQWIRCSPGEFGRFVDGLYDLTAEARAAAERDGTRHEREHIDRLKEMAELDPDSTLIRGELNAAEARLADAVETIATRYLPEWTCTVNRRQITVRGLWEAFEEEVRITEAQYLRVSMGSPSRPPRIDLQVFNRGVDIAFTASGGEWLDRNLPNIVSQLRRLAPKWGWIPRRAIITFVLITALPFAALGIAQAIIGQPWLTYTVLAAGVTFWIGLVIIWLPAVRFGKPRRPWWARGGQWLILAIVSGFIGALIAKVIG